jgi:hypothetical protein
MLEPLVNELKTKVLSSLEQGVYDQATSQDLVDTALRALVESAIDRLQLEMPAAASGLGAFAGIFGAVASGLQSLGLTDQIKPLLAQYQVDSALRDTVVRGLTRYLEENGSRLMQVALDAAVKKLGQMGR